MVKKKKSEGEKEEKKGRVKVGKLDDGKEFKDLTASEQKRVMAGAGNVRRPRTGADPEEEEDVGV